MQQLCVFAAEKNLNQVKITDSDNVCSCLFFLDTYFRWALWILINQCKSVFVIAHLRISPHGSKQEILPFTTIPDFVAMILILKSMKIRIGLHVLVRVQNCLF